MKMIYDKQKSQHLTGHKKIYVMVTTNNSKLQITYILVR